MISLIHPSLSRPEKSKKTIDKWMESAENIEQIRLFVVCNPDDPDLNKYKDIYSRYSHQYESSERDIRWASPVYTAHKDRVNSSVSAINYGAYLAFIDEKNKADILIVVSDDTDCFSGWDAETLKAVGDRKDWILKTQDGIQPWMITMPIMDRAYYNRFGYIYHPDYLHMFCDTELTCVADITGRKITSNLLFPHKHYSVTKEQPDEINRKADATWAQGEKLFLERYKRNFDLPKGKPIQDKGMIDWLQRKVHAR